MHAGSRIYTSAPLMFKLYAWISLLFFFGVLTHLIGSSSGDASPLSFIYQPLAALLYIGGAILLVSTPCHRSLARGYLISNPWITGSLVLVLASTLWSIDSSITARKAVAVVGTSVCGILIGVSLSRDDFVGFIRRALLVFVVASMVVALAFPEYGVHQGSAEHEGRWRGLLSFKNQMAWMAALFLVFWVGRLRFRSLFHPGKMAPLAIGLLVLLKCGSATGLVQAAIGVFTLLFLRLYAEKKWVRGPIIVIAIMGFFVLTIASNAILSSYLEATDRSETLSGRTVIWAEVWPLILRRPLLGYGQSAFWANASHFFGNSFWVGAVNHAHNAYVEILLDLGALGLFLQLAFLLALVARLWRSCCAGDPDSAVLLAALVAILVAGMAGPVFLRPNSGIWVLIVAVSAYVYARRAPKHAARANAEIPD